MSILSGKAYHIKDEFFNLVNDDTLMANKENGQYRPHYFCIPDAATPDIYWAVPLSSRVEKYRALVQKKTARYGKCNTIVLGQFGGKDSAFLIQNMFPITEKYIDHEHLIDGESVRVHSSLSKEIAKNVEDVLRLQRRGYNLVYPDIDRLYSIMFKELNTR